MKKNEVVKEIMGEIDSLSSRLSWSARNLSDKLQIVKNNLKNQDTYKKYTENNFIPDSVYEMIGDSFYGNQVKLEGLLEFIKNSGNIEKISTERESQGKKEIDYRIEKSFDWTFPPANYEGNVQKSIELNGKYIGEDEITDDITKEYYLSYYKNLLSKIEQLPSDERNSVWETLNDKVDKIENSKNVLKPHRNFLKEEHYSKVYSQESRKLSDLRNKAYDYDRSIQADEMAMNLKSELINKENQISRNLSAMEKLHEEITYADDNIRLSLEEKYNNENIKYNGNQKKIELIDSLVKNNQNGQLSDYNSMLDKDYSNYVRNMEEGNIVGPIETVEQFENKRNASFNNMIEADTFNFNDETREMEYFITVGDERIPCKENMTLKEYHNIYVPKFEEKVLNNVKLSKNASLKEKFVNKTKDILAKAMNKLASNPKIPFIKSVDSNELEMDMEDSSKTY